MKQSSFIFSIKTNKIYIGLLPYIDEFCKERGFEFEGVEEVLGVKERQPELDEFVKGLDLPFEPRGYQLEALKSSVQYGRQLLLSPTASGKSLIIYMLARYYNKKTIIIVPTTSLVEQMTKDFIDYGYKEPIYEYKLEAFNLFKEMLLELEQRVLFHISRIKVSTNKRITF